MKKLSLILLLILPVLSYAQTKYLLQQNLLMRSQLSFEENMVLVHVDPVTCLRGKNSKDRVRILKANIKTLEAKGELNHCPGTVILSKRRVLKNLKTQGIVLKDSLIKDGLDESKATKLVEVVPKLKEVDDVIQTSTDASSLHCVEKKKNDFPVGYVGVPFGIDENLDQTVSYRATSTSFKEGWECPAVGRGEHSLIFSSKNSPKGLSIYGDGGGYSLYSFPTVAGTFDFDVTGLVGGISANRYLKDKWKVTFLPTPKHTVFNSWERESGDAAGFLKGKAPFLELVWKGNYYPTPSGIRSASGVKQGKVYFEVRVKDIGDASKSFVAIDSSASEAGLIFARYTESAQWGIKFLDGEIVANSGKAFDPGLDRHFFKPQKISNGDLIMVALDATAGNLWFGLNGKWFYNNANPALGNTPTISGLKIPASLVKIDGFKTSHSLYGDYRALVAGREGTHLEANFGDQPWEYSPPAGFTGFPYQLPELESIANIWDYTTASETIEIRRANFFRGESVSSTGFFSRGMGGDAVLASSPRSSGRWQFELPIQNSSEDVRVGLVPSSFDTRIKQRLGGPGSKGISIQRQYHEMGYDQQMIVEVDGVVHPVGNAKSYQDEAFFTFDCDLDQKRVVIYYDGAKLFETALPAVPEGTSWSIGTTLARAWTDLRTVVPKAGRRVDKNSASSSTEIKFPVRGVKGWTLVDASQSNRAIPMPKPIPAPIPDPISDPVIPMPKPVPEIGKPAPVPGGGRRISPDDEELCSFDPRFGRRCQSRR